VGPELRHAQVLIKSTKSTGFARAPLLGARSITNKHLCGTACMQRTVQFCSRLREGGIRQRMKDIETVVTFSGRSTSVATR
jgi:hypothetical protein